MYRYEQKISIEYMGDEHCLSMDWGFDTFDDLTSDTITTICYPLKFNGNEYYDYGVCKLTGFIYSSKSGYWNIMRPNVSGKSGYPKVRIEGVTIPVHIAVMETLNPLPIPEGVSENEWERTPDSVKRFCRKAWFVNHKDHDKTNFSPNNLEWTTAKGNARAYQKFVKEQKNVH
jgi:hypothetical protein